MFIGNCRIGLVGKMIESANTVTIVILLREAVQAWVIMSANTETRFSNACPVPNGIGIVLAHDRYRSERLARCGGADG